MKIAAARRTVVAALALLTLGATAALPGATTAAFAADGAAVAVTWPEVTRFNPDVTPYEFTVTGGPAGGYLFSSWGWADAEMWEIEGEPVPESGVVTMDFSAYDGRGVVRIWACDTPDLTDGCTEAARSPELDVWSRLGVAAVEGGSIRWRQSGVHDVKLWYGPQTPGEAPTGQWEILGADRQPLPTPAGGALTPEDLAVKPATGLSNVEYTIPKGLPGGTYYLDIHLSVDTTDFGHLEGGLGDDENGLFTLLVDNRAPRLTVRDTDPAVYPVSDGYRDSVTVFARTSEPTLGTFVVTNAHGKRVYRSTGHRIDSTKPDYYSMPTWSGRRGGRIVPDGRYTMRLTAADRAGNTDTWTARITVSHKSLKWTTFTRTVTAAKSMVGDPFVGACSTLARPASGGPAGSLGFYSGTKCQGSAREGVVATTHGSYIPTAFDHRYSWVRVTLNGGPAAPSPANYIVMGYVHQRTHDLTEDRVFRAGVGAHHGERVTDPNRVIYDRRSAKPYILWSNGLTAGSRYDVRGYTVQVRYLKLR